MPQTATQTVDDGPSVRLDRRKLRRTRQLLGLSQAQLAADAKISFGYVGHLERGTRPTLSAPVFARLCDALHVQDRTELLITSDPDAGSM